MGLKQRFDKEMARRNNSDSTRDTYYYYIEKYIEFHKHKGSSGFLKDPQRLIKEYLLSLSSKTAATHNQALWSLVFLYKHVYGCDMSGVAEFLKAKRPRSLPTILNQPECRTIIDNLDGQYKLIALLLYGCGLRMSECLNLRIPHIDFERKVVIIKRGKGGKDRTIPLPECVAKGLWLHVEKIKILHQEDLRNKFDGATLPGKLKRFENYATTKTWQYIFPQASYVKIGKERRRHHVHESLFRKALKRAAANIPKRVTAHILRHTFATHLLENGYDIRTVQELLGHKSIKTTGIYLHVTQKKIESIESPVDVIYQEKYNVEKIPELAM